MSSLPNHHGPSLALVGLQKRYTVTIMFLSI